MVKFKPSKNRTASAESIVVGAGSHAEPVKPQKIPKSQLMKGSDVGKNIARPQRTRSVNFKRNILLIFGGLAVVSVSGWFIYSRSKTAETKLIIHDEKVDVEKLKNADIKFEPPDSRNDSPQRDPPAQFRNNPGEMPFTQ